MRESTELVERAAALRPVLEANQAAGDRERRLTDEAMAALADAGLFRMFVPNALGGMELGMRTAVDATAEVAKGDPSASWLVMILGAGDWLVGLYPEEVQREVYADGPDTHVCTVLTPRSKAQQVDGGWRLTGEWFPSSGCLYAKWALLGFPFGEQENGLAVVPVSELRVKDTWFTVGMRGTGSNLLIGQDVFVPEHRVLRMREAIAGDLGQEAGRYRSAFVPTLLTYMISTYLGTAEAALEHVVGLAGTRGVSFTSYRRQSDSAAFQLAVADASAKIDVARMLAYSCADVVDGHAVEGTYPDYLKRARLRLHAAHAVKQCGDAVDVLVSAHGASAVSESSPLNIYLRDMQTALRHAMISPAMNAEAFGRALLGVEPNITGLI
ncbi:acyl-CoA dehydrogenase [Lentzea sp. NBRC 105346]|uniref:acyl-CoA dehydrogenase family protein n=1 Tax=Lentzea sp. NBRC 105346 TaxID=3032205 RepID=UPI0024A18E43|nr:acyl-CoA dehydrogenase family protein [Lentzea sp. NBRC 105346]GLZ29586.1 acyl-CoA dehydrogenase [Lentzea sp. NBRC 105346]